MKLTPKILADGRLSISLTENDGTPVASRELSFNDAVNLFARWALVAVPTTGQQQITLEGADKDIIITLSERKSPLPEIEVEAPTKH